MTTLAFDPFVPPEVFAAHSFHNVSLDELFRRSHCLDSLPFDFTDVASCRSSRVRELKHQAILDQHFAGCWGGRSTLRC